MRGPIPTGGWWERWQVDPAYRAEMQLIDAAEKVRFSAMQGAGKLTLIVVDPRNHSAVPVEVVDHA